MAALQLFYDWAVRPVADLIAYLALIPIGLGPFLATIWAWTYIVQKIDGKYATGPQSFKTFVVAVVIAGYVFAVTATAAVRLPAVYYSVASQDDD